MLPVYLAMDGCMLDRKQLAVLCYTSMSMGDVSADLLWLLQLCYRHYSVQRPAHQAQHTQQALLTRAAQPGTTWEGLRPVLLVQPTPPSPGDYDGYVPVPMHNCRNKTCCFQMPLGCGHIGWQHHVFMLLVPHPWCDPQSPASRPCITCPMDE